MSLRLEVNRDRRQICRFYHCSSAQGAMVGHEGGQQSKVFQATRRVFYLEHKNGGTSLWVQSYFPLYVYIQRIITVI
jgi:hypothetical protein